MIIILLKKYLYVTNFTIYLYNNRLLSYYLGYYIDGVRSLRLKLLLFAILSIVLIISGCCGLTGTTTDLSQTQTSTNTPYSAATISPTLVSTTSSALSQNLTTTTKPTTVANQTITILPTLTATPTIHPTSTPTPTPIITPVITSAPVQPAGGVTYYASRNSDVFHYASCRYVKQISPGNLITFSSRDQAIAAGYRPCKVCNP